MSHQWSELGDCLELNYSDINSLRSSPIHSSSKEKLSEVLHKWKMQDTLPYTWLTIKDIVSGPVLCNRRVGSQIEKFLKKKKESKINFLSMPVHHNINDNFDFRIFGASIVSLPSFFSS